MSSIAGTAGIVFCAALLGPAAAGANKPKLHLERIDPAALKDDQLRLYATPVELEGTVVENLNPGQFTLLVDGRASGRALKAQPFSAAGEEVDVALVVETAAQYKKSLEAVKDAVREFFDEPPRRMRAMLIPFSSDFEPGRFEPAAAIAQQIDDLSTDEDSVDLRMADAVGAALTELAKLVPRQPGTAPPRRLIVLVSDGLNSKMDRATFKTLGDRAARAGVPIHTIAFSPTDERGPLLNLGELSKRSNGTFRWAKSAAELKAQFQTLAEEIKKQYVLTFKSPVASTDKHRFALRMDDVVSNVMGAGNVPLGREPSWLSRHWHSLAGGLGLLLVLLIVLLIVRARDAVPPNRRVSPKAAVKPAVKSAVKAPVKTSAGGGAGGARPATGGTATLVAVGGAMAGTRLTVRGPITIGKSSGQTVTVTDDPTVSGRHGEVAVDAQGPYVKDLGSTNGTFVNNQRITGMQRLRDGDIVRFGASTQFKVRID